MVKFDHPRFYLLWEFVFTMSESESNKEFETAYGLDTWKPWRDEHFDNVCMVRCRLLRWEKYTLDPPEGDERKLAEEGLKLCVQIENVLTAEQWARLDLCPDGLCIPVHCRDNLEKCEMETQVGRWSIEEYDADGVMGEQWVVYTDDENIDHVLLYKDWGGDGGATMIRVGNLSLQNRIKRREDKLCFLSETCDERFRYGWGENRMTVHLTGYLCDDAMELSIPSVWRSPWPGRYASGASYQLYNPDDQ